MSSSLLSYNQRVKRLESTNPNQVIVLLNKKPAQVYGYTRVSTIYQERSGLGLGVQHQQILDHCKHLNLEINPENIYTDAAESGRFMDRPEFIKLLETLKRGDILITHTLSRIARSTTNFLDFVEQMKLKGVRLICIKEGFDLNYDKGELSAISKFILTILASVAEFEALQTRERTMAAMDRLRDQGKLRYKPKFGYTYDEKHNLIEVPEEQRVIDYICLLIMENPKISGSQITRQINRKIEQGELVFRGKPKVFDTQINNIIRNNNLRGTTEDIKDACEPINISDGANSDLPNSQSN